MPVGQQELSEDLFTLGGESSGSLLQVIAYSFFMGLGFSVRLG
jgi:hypothetical protein